MTIFLKNGYQKTGMHRFLESMTILDCKIQFVDNIQETNNYSDEIGIYGGFLPKEVAFDAESTKKKYYVYCSPLGQADLSGQQQYSPEILILLDLLQGIKLKKIENAITQSVSLHYSFGFIYIPPFLLNPPKDIFIENRKNIGFLGNNLRKHKNVPNQIVAAKYILSNYKDEKLIVSDKYDYSYWAKIIDINIEKKELKTDEDYFKEIASHRLGLQCSFSEAFNYIALEYAFVGVPVIVGSCIDWYPIDRLKVSNVDRVDNILDAFRFFITFRPEVYKKLVDYAFVFNKSNQESLVNIAKDLGWIK